MSSSNYLYTRDHIGSARELTDSSGNIQAQYGYDVRHEVAFGERMNTHPRDAPLPVLT